MNATFLTVGEALTDIVVRPDRDPIEYPGGSPLNVAVALARMGERSHLLTHIGDDPRGAAIRHHVESSGVVLTPGSISARPTSTALAQIGETGAAEYTFDLVWDPDPRDLPSPVHAVHTSSIAAVLEPGRRVVREVLEAHRDTATLSYDPNARPALMGDPKDVRPIVEDLIGLCHVVKSSDEDIAWLYGTDDVEDVAASWRDLGPSVVAVTKGEQGAVGFGPSSRLQIPPTVVTVADTVGAGDTYSAGILWALAQADLIGADRREQLAAIDDETLFTVLRRAAELAAVTVSRPGADPPWRDEVDI